MPSNQRQTIIQAKFIYFPLGKVFEQRIKQIGSIANQNKRLAALTNKGNHKDICKEIFEKLVKEKLNEIKELTWELNHDNLTYYFTGNAAVWWFQ